LTVSRKRLDEVAATLGGAIKLTVLFGFPFLILGAISGVGMITAGPFAHFALGDVIPKFMPPEATNLAVFCLCALGMLCVAVAIIWRYFHHRKTIAYLRGKGVSDFDGDGRTDSFADKFLDDL
jgi:hypothetical protein